MAKEELLYYIKLSFIKRRHYCILKNRYLLVFSEREYERPIPANNYNSVQLFQPIYFIYIFNDYKEFNAYKDYVYHKVSASSAIITVQNINFSFISIYL